MGSKIEIMEDKKRVIHASSTLGGYETLCALDGDDPAIGTSNLGATDRRITCRHCKAVWEDAKRFTAKDFSTSKKYNPNN